MIEFAIESGSGEVLPLLSRAAGPGEFMLGSETTGFGISDVETNFASGAGTGARLLSARVGEQEGTIHVVVHHPDRHERQTFLRGLAHLIRFRPGARLPRMTAKYPSGETLERAFVYRAGGSSIQDGSSDTSEVLLEVTYPHPYWRARAPFEFRAALTPGGALLPAFDLQQVIESRATAVQQIENPGAVPVPVSWELTGPCITGAQVLVGTRGFTVGKALAAGERITVAVSSQGVTVTDQTGADRFADLVGTPEFPWLPEGREQVTMSMQGMTAASSIAGYIFPEFEVVHG